MRNAKYVLQVLVHNVKTLGPIVQHAINAPKDTDFMVVHVKNVLKIVTNVLIPAHVILVQTDIKEHYAMNVIKIIL